MKARFARSEQQGAGRRGKVGRWKRGPPRCRGGALRDLHPDGNLRTRRL